MIEMSYSVDSHLMIIAHRGTTAPSIKENTIEAFGLSLIEGADMIETDIRSTKDRKLICSHNAEWKNKKINEMTYEELKTKITAQEGWYPPLLSEVFALLDNGIQFNIEIKERGLERQVLETIPSSFSKERVIITSFEESVIANVKEIDSNIRTGLIVGTSIFAGQQKTLAHWRDYFPENRLRKAKADIVCPHYRLANKLFIQRLQKKGYDIYVWTVNHPEKMKKFVRLGVDGIFTDNISIALMHRK